MLHVPVYLKCWLMKGKPVVLLRAENFISCRLANGKEAGSSRPILETKDMITKHKLDWQSTLNDVTIDISMDVRVHGLQTKKVVLILPGVDGSVDGYENKYVQMADKIVKEQHKGVVRVSNHFITSFHWEDNLRQALGFIDENSKEIFGHEEVDIEIIAHSAGASVAAWLAWEYPNIKKLVLINTAAGLKPDRIIKGINQYSNRVIFIYGSEDPSVGFSRNLPGNTEVQIIEGADHYFSDEHLEKFIGVVDLLD